MSYTTPQGHTYHEPRTFEQLRERSIDYAQAYIECWPEVERPPAPTWRQVGLAIDEVTRLRAENLEISQAWAASMLEAESVIVKLLANPRIGAVWARAEAQDTLARLRSAIDSLTDQ